MDVMRSEVRRKKREEAVATVDRSEGGLASVDGDDTRAAVERGIQRLPADQREVLVLRFVDDLPLQEIADVLSIPLGTVKSRLHLGIARLRSSDFAKDLDDD